METQLATMPPTEVAAPAQFNIAALYQAVAEKGITAENVAVLRDLLNLQERQDTKQAERAFTAAFVALQADLPQITATSVILNRGKYERFEDLMTVVGPLLIKHAFTVSFDQDVKDNRMVATCHLKHVGGHAQSNNFAVRSGGRADSDTQADCKAATTAKRYALCNALNLIIRQEAMLDEQADAAIDGAFITAVQAHDLRERVRLTKTDEAKFLAYAGATKYEEIGSARLPQLNALLDKKEGK